MIRIYVRVSSRKQEHRSQTPDLKRWAEGKEVVWHHDKATGKTMNRPAWERLMRNIQPGDTIVVWRLDRLGRTASGLTALFDELQERKINLVSLRDHIDLSRPAGRMMANVLASVAQYETEVRGERIAAGLAAAKEAGKSLGGRKPGTRVRLTVEKERAIKRLHSQGESISAIARTVELSRVTVYKVLG